MLRRSGAVGREAGGGRLPATAAVKRGRGSTGQWRSRAAGLLGVAVASLLAVGAGAAPAVAADPCPNAAVRAQQHAQFLPDCRAYEMVSPVDKGGQAVDAGGNIGITRASVSGNAFLYVSWGNFADAVGGMPVSYRARRGADGWTSEAVTPAASNPYPWAGISAAGWSQTSSDLRVGYAVERDSFDPTDVSANPDGNTDIYRTDRGQYTELISRGNGAERTGPDGNADWQTRARSVSDDGRHALFKSGSHLVPADADRVTSPGVGDVYDRVDGVTYLVNRDDTGELLNRCGSTLGDGFMKVNQAISADGSHVVFQTPINQGPVTERDCERPRQVYVRMNNTQTVHVSASQRTDCATHDPCAGIPDPDPNGTQSATFVGASSDGRYVFLYSSELLTDDAVRGIGGVENIRKTGGIYRYDMTTDQLKLIQPGKSEVAYVSADGSTVYFISQGDFTPDATLGQYNLYARRGSTIKRIATTKSKDLQSTELIGVEDASQAVATPNGRYFLFATRAVLGSFDHTGYREVYLYNLDANTLICVSCDPAGQRPAGSTVSSDARFAWGHYYDPSISADGQAVVFETADRLVAGDANSSRDVYEYRDGRLALLTPGRASTNSLLLSMDPSGRNVFFTSAENLVGTDRDGNLDVYVARVEGGFAQPDVTEPPAPCAGDGCQGPLAAPPAMSFPGTSGLAGSATVATSDRPDSDVNSVRVSRVKTVYGRAGWIKVHTPGRGRIRVSGSGLQRSSKTVKHAGSHRVRVKLSRRARRTLKRRHRVRVRMTVRFAPTHGRRSRSRVRVTFMRKAAKRVSSSRSPRRATALSSTAQKER